MEQIISTHNVHLEQLEISNLVSFTFNENKLELTLKTIIDAIQNLNQKVHQLSDQQTLYENKNNNRILQLATQLAQFTPKNIHLDEKQSQSQNDGLSLEKQSTQKQLSSQNDLTAGENYQNKSQHSLIQRKSQSILADLSNDYMKEKEQKWQQDQDNILKELKDLQNKVALVGFLENQLENNQKEISTLKGDVLSLKQKVGNMSGNVQGNIRGTQGVQQPSLAKIKSSSRILSGKTLKNTDKNIQKSMTSLPRSSVKGMLQSKNNASNNKQTSSNKQNNPKNDSIDEEDRKQYIQSPAENELVNNLYIEMNNLQVFFEELKNMLSDTKKQTYKQNISLNQLKESLEKQTKQRKDQDDVLSNELKNLRGNWNQMKSQIQQNLREVNHLNKSQENMINQGKLHGNVGQDNSHTNNVNYKNQLNDKLSKLHSIVQNMVTSGELAKVRDHLEGKIDALDQRLGDNQEAVNILGASLNKITENIQEREHFVDQQLNSHDKKVEQSEGRLKELKGQTEKSKNVLEARIQQLKKLIQNLREDVQFYQSMNDSGKDSSKTNNPTILALDQGNLSKTNQPLLNHSVSNNKLPTLLSNQKQLEQVKKSLNSKIHDVRSNLIGMIRDLERKFNNKNENNELAGNQMMKLWDKLNEINLFVNKKANEDDVKKNLNYLEKKIQRVNGVLFKSEENPTEDARIARTNWFCLSCDKNLESYKGKIGRHVVWDTMPLKGINKVNQSILSRSPTDSSKKGFPQLKK